jgi:subtilisin family serine protease
VSDVRVGVAPGVTKLCVGKVLGPQGGTTEMMLKGMLWAVMEQKASVVSMSLGFDLPGNTKRLTDRGLSVEQASNVILRQHADLIASVSTLYTFLKSQSPNLMVVAASGNESERPALVLDASLPAAQLFAVGAVGATAAGDKWSVAPFSNGRALLVAPGVDVASAAVGGGWTSMSGTSMATPHVAGVAALWVEKARTEGTLAIPGSIEASMKAFATRTPLTDADIGAIGAGMVQAPQS